VVHILLVNFISKLMNVCLMKTQFFRWSDRHAALPMVLVPRVVVTHIATAPDTDRGIHGNSNQSVTPTLADAAADGPTDTAAATETFTRGQS
jgi:hypothetical protein